MTSLAAWLLTASGIALLLIGGYFLTARPALLPEDARFMSSTIEGIARALPTLSGWLRRVFWVLGGYIIAKGILVVYVANTGVRSVSPVAVVILAVAGGASLGWMSVVNFLIRSEFSWALLALDCLWILSLLIAVVAGM